MSAPDDPSPPETDVDNAGVPVPPPLFHAGGLLIGIAAERLVPPPRLPRAVARPAGLLAIGAGVAFIASSGALFRRLGTSVLPVRPSTALAETGPYKLTRNPMYVGMALLQTGLALRLGATWSLVMLGPVVVAIDRVVIEREERYLERRFGDAYRDYRGRVRRWL